MLPGKKYQIEDLVWIAWRWKWLVLASFLVVASTTYTVVRLLPDRYRSDELIEVMPQRVSQAYVRSTVTIGIEDRLGAIQQRIRSRTSLERIVRDYNLYEQLRRSAPMEDVIERMQKDIEMVVIRSDAFRLSFFSTDPRKAMQVTEKLASLVINESLQDRSGYADSTSEFLLSQLENARRQLAEQEQKVADYQRRNMGSLPSERESNLQFMQNLQMQVQALVESINRDRDQHAMLERTLTDLTSAPATGAPVVTTAADNGIQVAAGSSAAQLEAARNSLRAMMLRLTPNHPDVARQERTIKELEAKVAAEAMERPVSDGTAPVPATPEEAARQRRVAEVREQLANLDVQLKSKEATEKRLRTQIASAEGRVSVTPLREAEMTALTRDYDTKRRIYENLLAKYEDSKVAANLEHREIGEQFRVLDPARLPQVPISPKRPFLYLMGALAGLALGLGLVAALEYLDKSMRTEADVTLCLSLPVVALVPVLDASGDRRRWRRRRLLRSAAAITLILVAAAAVYAWKIGWLAVLLAQYTVASSQ